MGVTAKIVIRVTDEATKKRRWVKATGKKSDPAGFPFYLRYCIGSSPKYKPAGHRYDEALAAKIKFERELKVASIGAVVIEEAPATQRQTQHRIADVLEAYIDQESKPDKNGDARPAKSLKSIRTEIAAFTEWSGKTCVEELTRATLEGYRDWLMSEGKDGESYQPDTAYNKLMVITTFLKNNNVCPLAKPLLPVSEFPDKKETIPDPYTEEEFNAFMAHADYEDALRIYAFITSGMRDQEWANAEKSDINWDLGSLYITKKRARGFLGKTRAALREVPQNDDLLAELALRPEGLLFPAPEGGVNGHFIHRVEEIAKRAGIMPTTEKPHMRAAGMVKDDWLHRFRDTYITNQLFLHCANMAETMQLCKRIGHSDTKTLEKYFGKLKRPYEPALPERHRKAKNISEMRKGHAA